MLDVSAMHAYFIRHWGSHVPFEGSCRQGAKGAVEGGLYMLVLLVCELSAVPGSVVWGQEQGDVSLAAGTQQHQLPWPRLQKFHFFLWVPFHPGFH